MLRARWLLLVVIALVASGCIRHRVPAPLAAVQRQPGTGALLAGAVEVDITPPPGLPLYGWSSEAGIARGVWTRLKARVIVLQDAQGTRAALVQVDLGAPSALLHRAVAAELAGVGIGPENLMIAATHAHGGPGNYFGVRFFNQLVGAAWGFDEELFAWLRNRIVGATEKAFADLKPARLGRAARSVDGAAHNRSAEAWANNYADLPPSAPVPSSVDDEIVVLRVDQVSGGQTQPLGAFAIFPVHGTAVGPDARVYHGDLQGVASRVFAAAVAERYQGELVAAFATGPEGDVGPGRLAQSRRRSTALASSVGQRLGLAAAEAYASLDGQLTDGVTIRHAYRELRLPEARVDGLSLCEHPRIGLPLLAGSEGWRGPLYGQLGMVEGNAREEPKGCHGRKKSTLGELQGVLPETYLPDTGVFQIIELGPVMTLATYPGEPTTEVGRAIRSRLCALRGGLAGCDLSVVAMANANTHYTASKGEYAAQHYEGGATLWGPHQAKVFEGVLASLHGELGVTYRDDFARETFDLGKEREAFVPPVRCEPASSGSLHLAPGYTIFRWQDDAPRGTPCSLPRVRVECGGQTLRDAGGLPQSDEGVAMMLHRIRRGWIAIWREGNNAAPNCQIVVDGTRPLRSTVFSVPNGCLSGSTPGCRPPLD